MYEVLRIGDKDPRIAEARKALIRSGYLAAPDSDAFAPPPRHAAPGTFFEASPLTTGQFERLDQFTADDMIFDVELASALRLFQQDRGLVADGVITETLLRDLRGATYRLGSRVLQYIPGAMMVGDDVMHLQRQLTELGFYTERIDGYFGPATYDATKNYQLNSGLNPDGTCGPDTVRALSLLGRRITGGSIHAIHEHEIIRQSGTQLAGKRVVIDPVVGAHRGTGHVVEGPYGSVTEHDIVWGVAQRLQGRMTSLGMETIVSRPPSAQVSEAQRAAVANSFGADLVISLACDFYAASPLPNGAASFYYGTPSGNSSLIGQQLSSFIQREIAARTTLRNCWNMPKTWDILKFTQMPAVSVYMGYLSNMHDRELLTNAQSWSTIAEAILVAVKRLYLLDMDTAPTGTFDFATLMEQEGLGIQE